MLAASERDPSLSGLVWPYLGMATRPESLTAAHDAVRALLRTGWRPQPSAGPSADELVDTASRAQAGAGASPSRARAASSEGL